MVRTARPGAVRHAVRRWRLDCKRIHPTASEFGTTGGTIQPNTVSLTLLLDMLITKSYARLLSEPTLVTFSGKEASFLVGEEIPIVEQLPQSFTVEFKEVGVRMKIKPTADSENRINTTIHAEVSQVIGTARIVFRLSVPRRPTRRCKPMMGRRS